MNRAQILQWVVICLLGLGVVMIHSAGIRVGEGTITWMGMLTGTTVLYALLAIAVMLAASRVNLQRVYQTRGSANPTAWGLIASTVLCALVLIPGVGMSVKGVSRWIAIGPESWGLSFQPSELAKWALIPAMAWWAARQGAGIRRFWTGFTPAIIVIGVVCGLIVVEDLGTAALIGGVAVLILVAGGAKLWHVGLLIPPALITFAAAIWTAPYRMQRLVAFLEPFKHPRGIGYHPIQSMTAIAMGGLFGRGLGNGLQKAGYVPEDTTDFIFAIICEELGFAGAALVIGLYLVLFWTGLGIASRCRDAFTRLVALGVILMIGSQAIMNIAVVTVVVPTKGIALPLVSYGGTGWVMTAGAVGLLAAIDRLNRMHDTDQVSEAMNRPEPQVPAQSGFAAEA